MRYEIPTFATFDLRAARETAGLSGREFAKRIKMDYAHVWRLEKGHYTAKYETAQKIMKYFDSLSATKH